VEVCCDQLLDSRAIRRGRGLFGLIDSTRSQTRQFRRGQRGLKFNNGGKMTTEEVAKKVVELVRKQAWYEALDTLYDNDIVSVEATAPESQGKEAVRGKVDWWLNAMQVHSFEASEPFVAHDRFVVQYDAEVTEKESKKRRKMSEVGVYTVKNGKIVREEFLPRIA
jgi:hypothetical protein